MAHDTCIDIHTHSAVFLDLPVDVVIPAVPHGRGACTWGRMASLAHMPHMPPWPPSRRVGPPRGASLEGQPAKKIWMCLPGKHMPCARSASLAGGRARKACAKRAPDSRSAREARPWQRAAAEA
jgi:hypothetical protein